MNSSIIIRRMSTNGKAIKSLYDFTAKTLTGEDLPLAKFRNKVVLIQNTASAWGTTTRDFLEMNQLLAKYAHQGNGFAVLAFPCNQFGHQENLSGEEIVQSLKHVRPGGGYEPNCLLMDKCEVNGANASPIFQFLKESLPTPSDDTESLMADPKFIIWKPVKRTDISWNFEKFLITADGKPYKRYSRKFRTEAIASDIENLLHAASKKGRK